MIHLPSGQAAKSIRVDVPGGSSRMMGSGRSKASAQSRMRSVCAAGESSSLSVGVWVIP